jgi:transketolase
LAPGWDTDIPTFTPDDGKMATRVASQKVINAIAPTLPGLFGGSADLDPSTHSVMKDLGDFQNPEFESGDTQGSAGGGWSYKGRNVHFGVREHAMGGIINGIAAHGGLMPYAATFLIFSDYMRPTLRLAALMELGTKYIFTHDSIGLGEDGPTHQSVEQIPSMRAIPNFMVIRPCDANETAYAWRIAVHSKTTPVALIFTRQKLPVLDRTKLAGADGTLKGAYVLADTPNGKPDIILIATGSEVSLVVEAREVLEKEGIHARVVSMPSWELFEQQSQQYRDAVLPPEVLPRLAVEAASPLGWRRYVGDHGDVIGVERFGASAPGDRVMKEYGFSVDNVCEHARSLVKNIERVQQ